MCKKYYLVFLLTFLLPIKAEGAPPIPARIGGTVTVDGVQLTQGSDTGFTFKVTKQDGTAYVPAAEDTDGLNASDWYMLDVPIFEANDQPGGANPGETAVIHVYKNGSELWVTSPANGEFAVGQSGSTTQIDLVQVVTCNPNGDGTDCNDSNVCTDDSCDPALGCQYANNTASCDDNNACTTTDTCSSGACVGGAPPNCDDSDVCTDDSCDPALGCQYANNTASCDDNDACTTTDTCSAGTCVGGAPPNCDDSDVCTDDSCDPAFGCQYANNSASCDDNNMCTTEDKCIDGVCGGNVLPDDSSCTDDNTCTVDDHCETGNCVGTVLSNGTECDDDNACTSMGTCTDGTCVGAAPIEDGGACDDGLFCTTNTTCTSGNCGNGELVTCNDDNVCTDDSCDENSAECVNANNTAGCDDGLFCTVDDICAGGACNGEPVTCNDNNVCTDDSCDENADACVNTNNTVACNDGDACTEGDVCSGGTCGGTDIDCSDGITCTVDTCENGNCVNTANHDACDDNNLCTDDSCDPNNGDPDTGCDFVEISDCINIPTPTGNTIIDPIPGFPGVSIDFDQVDNPGVTTVIDNGTTGDPLPSGFDLAGHYFDITTTATFTGIIEVCLPYDPTGPPPLTQAEEEGLSLLHFNENTNSWEDRTVRPVDTTNKIICCRVDNLSPFAAANPPADPDVDGDGVPQSQDCDDNDPNVTTCSSPSPPSGDDDDDDNENDFEAIFGGCSVASGNHNMSTGSAMANTFIMFLPLIVLGIRKKSGKSNSKKKVVKSGSRM